MSKSYRSTIKRQRIPRRVPLANGFVAVLEKAYDFPKSAQDNPVALLVVVDFNRVLGCASMHDIPAKLIIANDLESLNMMRVRECLLLEMAV